MEIEREFLDELQEVCEKAEGCLLEIEKKFSNESFDSLMRHLHNLKGTCSVLGLKRLEQLSHQLESLALKDRKIVIKKTDIFLKTLTIFMDYLSDLDETKLNNVDLNIKQDDFDKKVASEKVKQVVKIKSDVSLVEHFKQKSSIENLKVAIIDDDNNLLKSFQLLIEELGANSITYANIGEFRKSIVEIGIPDLLFIDLRLDKVSGLDVLKKLKELLPNLPKVLISGDFSPEDLLLASKHGAVRMISKPFTIEEVEEVLNHAKFIKERNEFVSESLSSLKVIRRNLAEKDVDNEIIENIDKLILHARALAS